MDRSLSSSDTKGKIVPIDVNNTDDRISKLSNDLLLKILSRVSTVDVVRTSVLSKRWVNVWKETSHLILDMRRFPKARTLLSDVTHQAAKSVTKVIEDHRGYLERCTILHYTYQYEEGMLETWIQSLVHVKHTKSLTLINFSVRSNKNTKSKPNTVSYITLDLPPKSFSHPTLDSLMLGQYNLETPHAFSNCWNLKNLKLVGISAEIGVFNAVLGSCTSLEALVLHISCHKSSGILKIGNRNLKFLHLSCSGIDGLEVSTPTLNILFIESLSCDLENVVIANPRLQFSRNYWTIGKYFPHSSYNISCPHQEEKSIGHEIMMSSSRDCMKRFGSMSVSVDLTNTKEVEMLRDVLVAWPVEMGELEILFKNNSATLKEGDESSIGRTGKNIWEETKPFPNAHFHAFTLWLTNFSGLKEEFAFASRLITQGTVVRTMMIKPSSFSPSKKLEIEAAVARLKKLPKFHKELGIFMCVNNI